MSKPSDNTVTVEYSPSSKSKVKHTHTHTHTTFVHFITFTQPPLPSFFFLSANVVGR